MLFILYDSVNICCQFVVVRSCMYIMWIIYIYYIFLLMCHNFIHNVFFYIEYQPVKETKTYKEGLHLRKYYYVSVKKYNLQYGS